MNNADLLLRIYKMRGEEVCLLLRVQRECCKITGLVGVLPFVANLKQLAMAFESGASQQCTLQLRTARGTVHELSLRFFDGLLSLELLSHGKSRFTLQLTARAFLAAVEGMLAKLPKFF